MADSPAFKASAAVGKAEYDTQMKAWNDQCGAAFNQAMEEWTKGHISATDAHAPLPPRPKPPGAPSPSSEWQMK